MHKLSVTGLTKIQMHCALERFFFVCVSTCSDSIDAFPGFDNRVRTTFLKQHTLDYEYNRAL